MRYPCRPVSAQRDPVRAGRGRHLARPGAQAADRPGSAVPDPAGHGVRAGHGVERRSGRFGHSPGGEFDRDRPGPAGHPRQRDVWNCAAIRAAIHGGGLAGGERRGGPGDRYQLAGRAAAHPGAGNGGDSPQVDQQ